jgi:hypothetical protein
MCLLTVTAVTTLLDSSHHQQSSSKVLDSIQQEDKMELKDLTEVQLFSLLKQNEFEDLVHVTKDEFSAGDAFSIEHGIYLELKCRRTHYDTLMIEKLKYDRLKEEATAMGLVPMYICSTPAGIWLFDLDLTTISWEDRDDLPATTEFANGERIVKTVGYLPLGMGKLIMAWFPDYNSESEWFASNMEQYMEVSYTDPGELDLENMEFDWNDPAIGEV